MSDGFPDRPRRGRHSAKRTSDARIATIAITVGALAITVGVGIALLMAGNAQPVASSASTVRQPVATQTAPAEEETAVAPPTPEPIPEPPIMFDATRALAEVRSLESFGVRKGGSANEAEAADWLRRRLGELGYTATVEDVPLPNGTTSHNVIARSQGAGSRVVILGGHYDSKAPSPGANDNGTGCGALLEIARILASQPVTPTVEFVFFGTEEMIDSNGNHHHYGSRFRANAMSAADKANTAGMISVDMIGYGPDFHSRTMLKGPQTMSDLILAKARETGVPMTFLKDKGSSGWSDHEAFELAGMPAAWIEWRDDPVYHTADDNSAHLDPDKVRVAGQLVLDVVRSLDESELERLCAR